MRLRNHVKHQRDPFPASIPSSAPRSRATKTGRASWNSCAFASDTCIGRPCILKKKKKSRVRKRAHLPASSERLNCLHHSSSRRAGAHPKAWRAPSLTQRSREKKKEEKGRGEPQLTTRYASASAAASLMGSARAGSPSPNSRSRSSQDLCEVAVCIYLCGSIRTHELSERE